MDSMSNSISAVELAKDVDGADQMIEEHNERKVGHKALLTTVLYYGALLIDTIHCCMYSTV